MDVVRRRIASSTFAGGGRRFTGTPAGSWALYLVDPATGFVTDVWDIVPRVLIWVGLLVEDASVSSQKADGVATPVVEDQPGSSPEEWQALVRLQNGSIANLAWCRGGLPIRVI